MEIIRPGLKNSKDDRICRAGARVWVLLRLDNAWHVAFETKAKPLTLSVVAAKLLAQLQPMHALKRKEEEFWHSVFQTRLYNTNPAVLGEKKKKK